MTALTSIPISNAPLPVAYQTARAALAECQKVDEVKTWADKAAALASYARQADDVELEKMAVRIRSRAFRRMGEILKQIEPASGARTDIQPSRGAPTRLTRRSAAEAAGLSKDQQVAAIRVASIPADEFEKKIESDFPPTVTALAEQGTTKRGPKKEKVEPDAPPPPDPETWLKGRDPKDYNRVLHFKGEVRRYSEAASEWDLDQLLPHLLDEDREKLRTYVSKIDAIHDQIMTRI